MGFCQQRFFMLTICLLQIISIAQRQVFDFLGYLWIPILINFFQIIFVIFGFYGTFQYRPKYIISYSIWHLFYFGWNMFLICLYLDIGILDHKQNIVIKLDQDSYTWWSQNGPGCQKSGPIPIYEDKSCIIDYRYIEIFQAGLQCFLAFFGIISGLLLSRTFLEEDDSFNYIRGDGKDPHHMSLQPMYVENDSIPLHPMHAFSDKTESLLSLHSNKSKVGSSYGKSNKSSFGNHVHTDLIRFQNPVYQLASNVDFDGSTSPDRITRPKSLFSEPTDAY